MYLLKIKKNILSKNICTNSDRNFYKKRLKTK